MGETGVRGHTSVYSTRRSIIEGRQGEMRFWIGLMLTFVLAFTFPPLAVGIAIYT